MPYSFSTKLIIGASLVTLRLSIVSTNEGRLKNPSMSICVSPSSKSSVVTPNQVKVTRVSGASTLIGTCRPVASISARVFHTQVNAAVTRISSAATTIAIRVAKRLAIWVISANMA